MASRSFGVSVGSPTMKYSLIRRQPAEKALRVAASTSESVKGLLITRRRRSVPASGAMVNPDLRTVLTRRARFGVRVSARREGRLAEMRRPAKFSKKRSRICRMWG
jgi:hypothetical protein